MKHLAQGALAAASLLLSTSIYATEVGLDLGYSGGAIDGYLQTPAGGNPGSSSPQRPTFEELGIDRVAIVGLGAWADWERHRVNAGVQRIRLSEDAVLGATLTSQNQIFAAGAAVSADARLDWYRIGYLYRTDLLNNSYPGLGLRLGGELVGFDFDYRLAGGDSLAHRAYHQVGYRLGGSLEWRLNDELTLQMEAFAPLPVADNLSIINAEARLEYRPVLFSGTDLGFFAAVGYEEIDFEDSQTLPNHIHAEMGPLISLGLNIGF